MRRLLVLTLLAGLLAVPCAAQAAATVVVRGAGFGHGIGMSQYGAYGFAQHGWGYRQILGHYYVNTSIGTAPSRPVRVLLQPGDPYIRFRGASVASGGERLNPTVLYKVTPAGGGLVTLTGGGKKVGTFKPPLRVSRTGHTVRLMGRALNGVNGGLYRGALEIRSASSRSVMAVNSLAIDDYVKGVVPGEMPASWAPDALRAQAVAARTYALATAKTGGSFDQYPDTRSQVYRGKSAEMPTSNQAVADTARQIVTYDGAPAVTYFFSTSGGKTEDVENSFVGSAPKPWLKSVDDPYDTISPKHRWTARFSAKSLGSRLGVPGSYQKIRVIQRGESPRIVRARVYGSKGTKLLTGPQIRSRLGLNDTWAYFSTVSSSQTRAARSASTGAVRRLEIDGTFDPAPRGRRLLLERRRGHHWKRVARVATTAHGRYHAAVAGTGVYRVRWGGVAGPAVRVRN
jgi:stage II sporulation protein D